jgi:hypothetical protein
MTVKLKSTSDIDRLMEALREKLGARAVLCAVFIAGNGKLNVCTHPGMNDADAKRCAQAVVDALGLRENLR